MEMADDFPIPVEDRENPAEPQRVPPPRFPGAEHATGAGVLVWVEALGQGLVGGLGDRDQGLAGEVQGLVMVGHGVSPIPFMRCHSSQPRRVSAATKGTDKISPIRISRSAISSAFPAP